MSTNANVCREFLIEIHAKQLMQSKKNLRSFQGLINNDDSRNLILRLLNNGIAINQSYEPLQNYSILINDISEHLNITININQIDSIAVELLYSVIIHFYKVYQQELPKNALYEELDKNIALQLINRMLKTNLNISQVEYLITKILDNMTIFNLNESNKLTISNIYHLLKSPRHIIASIEVITNKQLSDNEYYVLVERAFKSLSFVSETENQTKSVKLLSAKLKAAEKLNRIILASPEYNELNDVIFRLDPTLSKNHPLYTIDFREIQKNKIHVDNMLEDIRVQKSGALSHKNIFKRACLSIFFLGQLYGIPPHDIKNNFTGNKFREFLNLIFGKKLCDKYSSIVTDAYNEYASNPIIVSITNELIQNYNTSIDPYEALKIADQTFSSRLIDVLSVSRTRKL